MSKNIFFLNIKNISKKFQIMSPNILLNLNVSTQSGSFYRFICKIFGQLSFILKYKNISRYYKNLYVMFGRHCLQRFHALMHILLCMKDIAIFTRIPPQQGVKCVSNEKIVLAQLTGGY